jgi:hypothetical protein
VGEGWAVSSLLGGLCGSIGCFCCWGCPVFCLRLAFCCDTACARRFQIAGAPTFFGDRRCKIPAPAKPSSSSIQLAGSGAERTWKLISEIAYPSFGYAWPTSEMKPSTPAVYPPFTKIKLPRPKFSHVKPPPSGIWSPKTISLGNTPGRADWKVDRDIAIITDLETKKSTQLELISLEHTTNGTNPKTKDRCQLFAQNIDIVFQHHDAYGPYHSSFVIKLVSKNF